MPKSLTMGGFLATILVVAPITPALAADTVAVEWVSGDKTIGCFMRQTAERLANAQDLLEPIPQQEWFRARDCVHYSPKIALDIVEGHDPLSLTKAARKLEIWKVRAKARDGSAPVFGYVLGVGAEVSPQSAQLRTQIRLAIKSGTSREAILREWNGIRTSPIPGLNQALGIPMEDPRDPGHWMLLIRYLTLAEAVGFCDGMAFWVGVTACDAEQS